MSKVRFVHYRSQIEYDRIAYSKDLSNFSNADLVSYEHNDKVVIVKSRYTPSGEIVSYDKYFEILTDLKAKTEQSFWEDRIKELTEIAKKYNVAIFTAKESVDPNRLRPFTIPEGYVIIDYLDKMR